MDIVVIGAGLSGLTAATVLREAGADVLLIEAGAGIGGRIRAIRDPETNAPLADLGPTWVWPKYQPVARKWIERLQLRTFQQFNDGDAVIEGYGPGPIRQPLPGQDGMVRIVGGPTAFVDAMYQRLDPSRIRRSAPVAGIAPDGPGQIAIRLASGDVVRAGQVVLCIPLRVAAETLDMPWAPPALLDVMKRTPTWMSSHAKAVAIYDRPFWREQGLSGRIASRTGPLVEAHDHSGPDGAPAAIFGFVGWPPDQRQNDPETLRQAILAQLVRCFGPAAAAPKALVVQDWSTDRHIATDLDISGPAHHPDVGPEILRQSFLDGRVRFAVSETSGISPGLIEGALAAGERAAREMIDAQI